MTTVKTNERPHTNYVEATPKNVNDAISKIRNYAEASGYTFNDQDMPSFKVNAIAFWNSTKLDFDSKSKMKVCRNYLTRLERKMSMANANRFMHFIWRTALRKEGPAPRLEFGAKEQLIRKARAEWKAAQKLSDSKLAEYKTIKGDFYKK